MKKIYNIPAKKFLSLSSKAQEPYVLRLQFVKGESDLLVGDRQFSAKRLGSLRYCDVHEIRQHLTDILPNAFSWVYGIGDKTFRNMGVKQLYQGMNYMVEECELLQQKELELSEMVYKTAEMMALEESVDFSALDQFKELNWPFEL